MDQRADLPNPEANVFDNGENGRVFAVGLNWYPERWLKLMINGLWVTESNLEDTEKGTIWQLRVHARF